MEKENKERKDAIYEFSVNTKTKTTTKKVKTNGSK